MLVDLEILCGKYADPDCIIQSHSNKNHCSITAEDSSCYGDADAMLFV